MKLDPRSLPPAARRMIPNRLPSLRGQVDRAAQILSGLESRSSSSAGIDPAEVAELQGNLYKFSRAAWPVTEIGRAFVDGWHLGVLSEHLQAVTELQIHNLVINMPPRHGKSLWAAVFWFAWAWAGDPTTRWLTSSYADDLVTRDAMKAHNLIDSGWYQRRWGHKFQWGKKDTDTWYENNRGGYRISTTVGGKGTGHGGDYLICFPYHVIVATEAGPMPIGRLVEQKAAARVWAFNHATGRPELRAVECYERHAPRPCVTVRLSDGRTLEATADHPVYVVGSGYVKAGELVAGQEVLTYEPEPTWRAQPPMAWRHGATGVRQPGVWSVVHGQAVHSEAGAESRSVLFQAVPVCGDARRESPAAQPMRTGVRFLLRCHASNSGAAVLREGVQESVAPGSDARTGESAVRTRGIGITIPGRIPVGSGSRSGAVLVSVSRVPDDTGEPRHGAAGASRQLRQGRQHAGQSGGGVPVVSWGNAREPGGSSGMGRAFVVSVGTAPMPERVYNVRVADHHNYFANGVLVHNCDDPMKALDARSAAARLRVIEWWTKTMSTRINDPKSVRKVVIMQRLHEADLAGYLAARQDSDEGYDVLVMPAEHEPKRIFIIRPEPRPRDAIIATRIQRERPELLDPRTQAGELLWAARFGPKQLAALKIELEADGVAGQLQQRPSPADGTIFQRQHYRYAVRAMTALGDTFVMYGADGKEAKRVQVSRCKLFQCIDTAMKVKQSNDPTAVGTFAVTPDGELLILHMTADRIEIPFQLAFLKAMRFGPAKWLKDDKRIISSPIPWPRPLIGQWVEDAASGTMLLTSALAEGIVFRTLKTGTKDKVQRAAPLSALYEAGRVYHLKDSGPWLVAYEDEAATFPASAHDDRVDVAAYAAQVALYDRIVRAGMAGLEDVAASYGVDGDPFDPPQTARPWSLDALEVPAELPEPAILIDLGDGSDPFESADYGTLTGLVGPRVPVPTDTEPVPEGDWFDVFNDLEAVARGPKAPDPPPLPAGPDDPLSLD